MKKKNAGPNWMSLYLLIGIVMVVFTMEVKAPFSSAGHTWAETGLVLLLFGLVALWLKVNEAAMIREDLEKNNDTAHSQKKRGKAASSEQNLQESLYQYAGWSAPAWLAAIWSNLADIFHRLPWLQ